MNFSVRCRACGNKLRVTDEQLGTTLHCPVCTEAIPVPAPVDLGPRLKAPPPLPAARGKREAEALPSFGVICPHCGVRMRLLEKYRSTLVRCPDCSAAFTAGERSAASPEDENS